MHTCMLTGLVAGVAWLASPPSVPSCRSIRLMWLQPRRVSKTKVHSTASVLEVSEPSDARSCMKSCACCSLAVLERNVGWRYCLPAQKKKCLLRGSEPPR